jgi:hypothetical protein
MVRAMFNPVTRRVLALIAIYALVIQSLLAGVAMSVAAATGTTFCASQENGRALPDHGAACLSCATCSPAVDAPARSGTEVVRRFAIVDRALPLHALAQPALRHQPQAARAPPAG